MVKINDLTTQEKRLFVDINKLYINHNISPFSFLKVLGRLIVVFKGVCKNEKESKGIHT